MKPTDKELADLNAEMHKLCGWHYDASRRAWHRNGYWTAEPDHYTSDRAAAMEVWIKCCEFQECTFYHSANGKWQCRSIKGGKRFMVEHESETTCICLFAKQLSSK